MAKDKKEKKSKKEKKEKKSNNNEATETQAADDGEEKKAKKSKKDKKDKKSKKKSKSSNGEPQTFTVADLADKADVDIRDAKSLFNILGRTLEKMPLGSKVRLNNICNFVKIETKPRKSRNPRTGEPVDVPSKRKVKAKISNNLKNL